MGRDGIAAFDGTLLEHARKLGVQVASECGGLALQRHLSREGHCVASYQPSAISFQQER